MIAIAYLEIFVSNLCRIDSIVVFRTKSIRPETDSVFEMKRIRQETLKCELGENTKKMLQGFGIHCLSKAKSHEIRGIAL